MLILYQKSFYLLCKLASELSLFLLLKLICKQTCLSFSMDLWRLIGNPLLNKKHLVSLSWADSLLSESQTTESHEKQLGETGVRGKGKLCNTQMERRVHRETPTTFKRSLCSFASLGLGHSMLADQKHHTLTSLSVCPSSVFLFTSEGGSSIFKWCSWASCCFMVLLCLSRKGH